MRQELWIDGQRVDLNADTAITLEWVSGLFEDIGSIQLSRSYTIKLPKTARNLRILDDPGNPAHASSKTRRYLDAQYLRNGIDLLGPAQAYIVDVTADGIEVGLLWRSASGLLEWKEADKKLSDLATLPTLQWIGSNGKTPDYATQIPKAGAFFAHYDSGLGSYTYPDVNGASHPAVTFKALFGAIAQEAGLMFDTAGAADLEGTVLLCDGHRPNRRMDQDSGSTVMGAVRLRASSGAAVQYFDTLQGWDPTLTGAANSTIFLAESQLTGKKAKKMYADISLVHRLQDGDATYESLADNAIQVIGITELTERVLMEIPFVTLSSSEELAEASLDIDSDDLYGITLRLKRPSADPALSDDLLHLYAYYRSYSVRVAYAHDTINLEQYNSYPVAVNLPSMTQVEFIKGACALLGLVPVVRGSALQFRAYADILDASGADDWTDRVDSILTVGTAYDGLARRNYIRYAENADVYESPDGVIVTEDATLSESADLYDLPFAASVASQAIHYSVGYEETDGVLSLELKDVSINPRVFDVHPDKESGELHLVFPERLRGEGLVDTYYSRYQSTVRKPVTIEALVRLNELDLVALDFTRPVYLAQTGQYYAIKSVQADDSDLCKVELIQIA